MSVIDEVLEANRTFAQDFTEMFLPVAPARRLAVVVCMDARLDMFRMLGLKIGDAHVIRNAGGVVTEDVLRSLVISHHLLGTQEFMVINHTHCGLMTFREEELHDKIYRASGTAAVSPSHFYAFGDLHENVRRQVQKLKTHPWIPQRIPIRGFIYDVMTGKLEEVET
jgi:carbonic anhydrase